MEPVEGALVLSVLHRAGTIDGHDVEVAIGLALLADSRSEAIRLAGKYQIKKLAGRTLNSDPDAYPKAVGWLWKVLAGDGRDAFERLVLHIRALAIVNREKLDGGAR